MKIILENMSDDKSKSLKESILDLIKSGEISMRPRWHFVLKAILTVLGMAILFLAILYLLSFIFFILRASGVWFAPEFGFRGIGIFLLSLPWLLIALSIAFVVLLEVLVRQYSFAYRKPLMYSLAGIIVFVMVASFAIARIGFHERISRFIEEEGVLALRPFYRDYFSPRENVHLGTISTTTESGFIIIGRDTELLEIVLTPETRFPGGIGFDQGDIIVVLGEKIGTSTIEAFGVRKMDGFGEHRKMRQHMPRFMK